MLDANMREMIGKGVPIVFKVSWYIVTPVLLAVTLGFTIYTYRPPAVGNYEYPQWAVNLGWCIALSSLVPIPAYMMGRIYQTPGSITERIRLNLQPNEKWGPLRDASEKVKKEVFEIHGMIAVNGQADRLDGQTSKRCDDLLFHTRL